MSAIIVYNDIMLSKELSFEQRQTFLVNSQNQLNKMQWLIQSLLKLAKLDAKAIELNKETASLMDTLHEAVDSLESKSMQENISIKFVDNEDIFFQHDRLWLQEAFINIIKNGIEHTVPGGEIYIELMENPIYRRVIIKDTGEGIREEDLPSIFKRFYKAKTSKKADSIGVGLALSKAIIEAHNGVVEVRSKLGEGTTFIITFLKYL
jgi:signal transduction histidine kinase